MNEQKNVMDEFKEISRIRYEYFVRTKSYLRLTYGRGKGQIINCEEHNHEDRRKLQLFYMNNSHFFYPEGTPFDDVWSGIVSYVSRNLEPYGDIVIDTVADINDFFLSHVNFFYLYGRYPSWGEVFKAIKNSKFSDRQSFITVSIPKVVSVKTKQHILRFLDQIKSSIQDGSDIKSFSITQELFGVYGKPQLDKLKRYLGVYILKYDLGLSYGQISKGGYIASNEFTTQVLEQYKDKERSDIIGMVKDDLKIAKRILNNIENGFFPFPPNQDGIDSSLPELSRKEKYLNYSRLFPSIEPSPTTNNQQIAEKMSPCRRRLVHCLKKEYKKSRRIYVKKRLGTSLLGIVARGKFHQA